MNDQTVQQAIQKELERLSLASTEMDFGGGGGLDVDYDYDSSDNVKIEDSQETTIFDAFKLLPKLEAAHKLDFDGFWERANDCIIG